jgi:hypothetical protein
MNKAKYTSLSAFIKGVQHVNETLTDGERLTMFALLGSVDYKTACSHPGIEELKKVADRSKSGIHLILRSLIAKNLIELTEMGNGRGHATVYRFRVEDERYPEPHKKPSTSECTDIAEKGSTLGCTVFFGNGPVAENKGSTCGQERVHLEAGNGPLATDTTSLNALPQRTSSTPSSANPAVAVGSVSNPNPTGKEELEKYVRLARKTFTEHLEEMECGTFTLTVKEAESLFIGRDPEIVDQALMTYLARRNWNGLTFRPQSVLLSEFPDAYENYLEELAKDERKQKECAEAYRQIAEINAKAEENHEKLYGKREEQSQALPVPADSPTPDPTDPDVIKQVYDCYELHLGNEEIAKRTGITVDEVREIVNGLTADVAEIHAEEQDLPLYNTAGEALF